MCGLVPDSLYSGALGGAYKLCDFLLKTIPLETCIEILRAAYYT